MQVSLVPTRGSLQSAQRGKSVAAVNIGSARFIIGTGDRCHLRCQSTSISPHHCAILLRGRHAIVVDLQSDSGTYVNEQRIAQPTLLMPGDTLRFGRLEFQVVYEATGPELGDDVSDWLSEADMEDEAAHDEGPHWSRVSLEEIPGMKPREPKPVHRPKKPAPKTPPAGTDSVDAAKESLHRMLYPRL